MGQIQYTFARYEKKYILTVPQYEMLREKIEEQMEEDAYGLHTICNIYCDTACYDLIRRSIRKPDYKEKFRFRSYGVAREQDDIFAEIKKKYAGIVYKRRMPVRPDRAEDILLGKGSGRIYGQIGKEITWLTEQYRLSPKVFIGYERVALAGKTEKDVRITFDRNLRWRTDCLDLRVTDEGKPLVSDDCIVMEIKLLSAMPLWLTRCLSECRIYPGSFSKYGTCYENYLAKDLLERSADIC